MNNYQLNVDNWCQITSTELKTSFIFTIDNFTYLPHKQGETIQSSRFSAPGDPHKKWYLEIYPNENANSCYPYTQVYIRLENSNETSCKMDYKLALIDANGKEAQKKEHSSADYGQNYLYLDRKDLTYSNVKQLLPNNRLTIYCELKYYTNQKTISGQILSSKQSERNLFNVMTQLYNSLEETDNKDTDVEILVSGKSFRAHKLVLKTSSPVFKAMFSHQMIENQTNKVVVEDIGNDVFEAVLRYVTLGFENCPKFKF